MDLVFVCKDGDIGSLWTNFVDAIIAKKNGVDAGLILTQEALLAMVTGEMSPRPALDKYSNALGELASKIGVPSNRNSLLAAAREAGVPVTACGGWTEILGLQRKLPEGVEVRPIVATLLEAQKVVGGF